MQIRQILLLQGLALLGNAQPTDIAAPGPHNDKLNALRARGPDPNNMDPALKLILGKDWREIEKKHAYDNQNKQTGKKSQEPDFAARVDFAAQLAELKAFRDHRDAGTKIVLGENWKEVLLAPKLVASKTTDVKDAKEVGCDRKDKSRPLSADRKCEGGLDKRDIGEEDEEEDAAEEEESTEEDGPADKEDPTGKPLDGSLIDLDFLKPENLLREVYEGFPTQDGRKPKTFFTSFSTQLSYDDEDGWQHHHQSVYHEQRVTWVPEEAEATPTDTAGKYNVEDDIQTDYEHEEDATPIPTRTRTKWRPRPGRKTAAPSEATAKPVDEKEEKKEAAPTTTEAVVKPTRRLFGVKQPSTTEATPTSTAKADDEIEELQAETSAEVTSTTVVSTSATESSPESTVESTVAVESSTTESAPETTAEATEEAGALVEEATSTTVAPDSTVETTSSSVEESSTAEPSTESVDPVPTSTAEDVDEALTEQAVTTTEAPEPTTEAVDSDEENETGTESTTAETTTVVVPSTTAEPTTTSAELSSASSTAAPTAPKATVIKDKVAVIAGAVAAAINGAEPAPCPTHLGERFTTEDAELTKILAHIPKDRPWDRDIGYPKLVRAWRKKIQAEKERHGKQWKDMTQREKELWIIGETTEKERKGKDWKDMTQKEKELWIKGETIE